MSLYFTLQLFKLEEPDVIAESEFEGLSKDDAREEGEREKAPSPYRVINAYLDDGRVRIESRADDPEYDFCAEPGEQLSNEFLIQTERMEIRKWNPIYYSTAFAGGRHCSWVLDYYGLKDESIMHSSVDTYPKCWQMLIDMIDALNDRKKLLQESVRMAAEHTLSPADEISMVHILSLMGMPQDVVAAGIFRAASRAGNAPDIDYIKENFSGIVADLLGEYGNDAEMDPAERRVALIEKVKASDSLYFKRLVLAEVLADLIRIKAGIDRDGVFDDPVMGEDEMGIYYAEMISALDVLGDDNKAGVMYSRLVDLYKTVFVSYYLDSVNGVLYQTQGSTACVCLKRGEYDWHAVSTGIPDNTEPLRKELALFLAGVWRREADEALVKDGNKAGSYDVPDITVLKVVMGKAGSSAERKDNEIVLSVLKRMMEEDEQIFAPMRAAEPDMELIENGDVDNVNEVAVSFLGLEDDEGKTMAAVFTSMDELGELDEDDMEAIPVKMVLEFVRSMSRLDGILIDPFSDRFTISKEKIAEVLDDLNKTETGM